MDRIDSKSRSTDRAARGAPAGFTLLEVMIAMAILSVSLVALAGINSGAMSMHSYAKRLTVATMLARSKMADIEQQLQSEGLPMDDELEEGTFEEEGYAEFRWQAQIIRPKTEDISVDNLMAMTGLGLTGGDEGGGDPLDMLGSLADQFVGDPAAIGGTLSGGAAGLASAAAGAGDMLGGVMQSQLQRMLDDLGKTMREVRLTVSWGKGQNTDQFTVVTHVVSLGAGTDQAQSDVVAQQATKALEDAAQGAGGNLPIMPGATGLTRPGGPLRTGPFQGGGAKDGLRPGQLPPAFRGGGLPGGLNRLGGKR
ncbi:MAG: type IV pilus modification PilV family protein [Myxococcales bacterium]|jgi:general secretion pathway protein I